MPWIALVCACVLGACSFEADYTKGPFYCRNNRACPPGLVCDEGIGECRAQPLDAAIDTPDDTMVDARQAALNCADPGVLPPTGGGDANTTVGRTAKVAAMCDGTVMTAADAVYRITPGAGKQMLVDIATSESFLVTAYVTSTCPSTTCLTNSYASPGNPISVMALAGDHYIVVDSGVSAETGAYQLTVTVD